MNLNYTIKPKFISPTCIQLVEEQWTDDPFATAVKKFSTIRVETKDKAIREALIALGWTPPPEKS